MRIHVYPLGLGFRIMPDDYEDPDVSPLITYLWTGFAATVFIGVLIGYLAVQRYSAEHTDTYVTCTLKDASVSERAERAERNEARVVFKTQDCSSFTYEGFNYGLCPQDLEAKLKSYSGQQITFRQSAFYWLPTQSQKTDQFTVGELDFRTWDIHQLHQKICLQSAGGAGE